MTAVAAAAEPVLDVGLTDSEAKFTLIAILMANAFLTDDYGQLAKIMKQLIGSRAELSPLQRADLIQKFTEALRA